MKARLKKETLYYGFRDIVMVDRDFRVGGYPQAEPPPGSLRMFTPL